jgi:predicted tellurium resistance membrane protein TerC
VVHVDLLLNPEVWVAFLTLLALEIVLGIDNIVFISILVDKLPEHRQALARRLGLAMALLMRIILLPSLSCVIGLTALLFTVLGQEISGRDVILEHPSPATPRGPLSTRRAASALREGGGGLRPLAAMSLRRSYG